MHPNAFPAVTYQKHTRRIPEQSLEVLEACSFFAYFFWSNRQKQACNSEWSQVIRAHETSKKETIPNQTALISAIYTRLLVLITKTAYNLHAIFSALHLNHRTA